MHLFFTRGNIALRRLFALFTLASMDRFFLLAQSGCTHCKAKRRQPFTLILTFVVGGLAICANHSHAQGNCYTSQGCSDYSNFGFNSTTAGTLEYDNYVSAFHSTVVRDLDGSLKIWGEKTKSDGSGSWLVPTTINAGNYPGLTGTPLKVAIGSAGINNVQFVLLTSDNKLWAWGVEGHLVNEDLTTGTSFQQLSLGLPSGVTAADVKMLQGTENGLILTTCGGHVYVLTNYNITLRGDGVTDYFAPGARTTWSHVQKASDNSFLTGIVAARATFSGAFALDASGNLWTWGLSWNGVAASSADRSRAVSVTAPTGASGAIKMIGMTHTASIYENSYYVLYTNGNLYAMGANNAKQLGNWGTANSGTWIQPTYTSAAGPVMNDIKWISPNEHDNGYGTINVLTNSKTVYAWGQESGNMLGRDGGATISSTPVLADPGVPGNFESGYDNTNILAVESGGHTTMVLRQCNNTFGYVGHRVNGSMGDNVPTTAYDPIYHFNTNAVQVCGANTTTAELNASVEGPYYSGNAVTLIGSPAGGTYALVSGPATLSGTTLTFTGTGTVRVNYTVNEPSCGGAVTVSRVFAVTVAAAKITIPGKVWLDTDGDARIDAGENGIDLGQWANLTGPNGTVIASVKVNSSGAYQFDVSTADIANAGSYSVILTNNSKNPGDVLATADTAANGYRYTGINRDATAAAAGRDANNHTGKVNIGDISTSVAGSTLAPVNFGVAPPAVISGTVFNDINRNKIINSPGENFTSLPAPLYVYMVNSLTGLIVNSTAVAANGTYSMQAPWGQQYTLYLSTQVYAIGASEAGINHAPPSGWATTGENNSNTNNGTGDFSSDGIIISLSVTGSTTTLPNRNFGITCRSAGTNVTDELCASEPSEMILYDFYQYANNGLGNGSDAGGNWTQLTGSGITFNPAAGTIQLTSTATTSTFQYNMPSTSSCTGSTSILTINILPLPVTERYITICAGQSVCVTNPQIAGRVINPQEQVCHTQTGIYYDTLSTASASGCDSIVITHLTVVSKLNAGADGSTTVCNTSASPIDLYSLITGEQSGGTWTRTAGTGGTFNAAVGTFTPAVGATSSSFRYILTAAVECANDTSFATITINNCTVSISGTVWNDADADVVMDGGEPGTNASSANLTAYLVDGSGNVVSSSTVAANGTYSLPNAVIGTTYTVVLSNTPNVTAGSLAPAASLPTGWLNTGESLGGTNDGTGNGVLSVTPGAGGVTTANFGIEERPVAGNGVVGMINQNGTVQHTVPTTAFTNGSYSTDPAPGNVEAIRITAFPTGATSIVINGITYTAGGGGGTTAWPTGGVTVPTDGNGNPLQVITVDPTLNDATQVSIPYVAIDNAGAESLNTGTAVINFIRDPIRTGDNFVFGTVYNDYDGAGNGVNNLDGASVSGLNAVLVGDDGLGNQVVYAVVPVSEEDGTYSFIDVPTGNFSVILTTLNPAVRDPAPASVMPVGWTRTGDNLGDGTGNDGNANGIVSFTITGPNEEVEVNFGILQCPGTPQLSLTAAACGRPGSIIVTSPSGPAFMYSKDGVTYQTSPYFPGLALGSYTIYVKAAAASCTSSATANIITGVCVPTGCNSNLYWNDGAGNIGFYDVNNNTNTVSCNNPNTILGDIAIDQYGQMWGAGFQKDSLYRINTFDCSFTPVAKIPFGATNSLSVLPDGTFLLGSGRWNSDGTTSVLPVAYRYNPVANTFTAWHDFGAGSPAGDFVYLNGSIYIAWSLSGLSNQNHIYKVEVDANFNYISHTDLGQIANDDFGLAKVDGVLYGVTGAESGTIIKIPLPNVADWTEVYNTTDHVFYGATSMQEAQTTDFPVLSGYSLSVSCPATGVNLGSIAATNTPSGASLEWFTNDSHTGAALTPTQIANAGAGTYFAFFRTGTCYSGASDTVKVTITPCPTISGNVFNDANGNTVINTGETFASLPVPLYVYLVNGSGKVVDSAHVAADGTYALQAGSGTNDYTLHLSAVQYPVGTDTLTTPIDRTLPGKWVTTGENLGNSGAGDLVPNGILAISTTGSSITNANFGIEQKPTANNDSSPNNPYGSTVTVSVLGNDTDPTPGNLVPSTVTMIAPNNATNIQTDVPGGDIISMTIPGEGTWSVNESTGAITFTPQPGFVGNPTPIQYTVDDNAGFPSNPATVTISYLNPISVSGNVFNDANGNTVIDSGEKFGGTTALPVPLYVYLVNTAGMIMDSAHVATDGTYELQAAPDQAYTLKLSTVEYTVGASPTILTTPPAGWVTTGENGNNNSGPGDGLKNGELAITTASNNMINKNFGIERPPVANDVNWWVEGISANVPYTLGTKDLNALGSDRYMNGTDIDDGPLTGVTPQNVSIKITSLIDATYAKLYYDADGPGGNPPAEITLGQEIPNYDPSNVSIVFVRSDIPLQLTFTYDITDAAGVYSGSPATYTINRGAILPATGLVLQGVVSSNQAILNWSTLTEQGSSYFVIERSTDGARFAEVGRVAASGTSNSRKEYTYKDDSLPDGSTAWYRVRLVGLDGASRQSNTIGLTFLFSRSMKIYPNPAKHFVTVSGLKAKAELRLLDAGGKLLRLQREGGNTARLNLAGLASGLYLLQVVEDGKVVMSAKIVKE